MAEYYQYTLAERPELLAAVSHAGASIWPRYMGYDRVCLQYWRRLFTDFPQYQLIFCDDHDQIMAMGHSIPTVWDGRPEALPDGWDGALTAAMQQHEDGCRPTALLGLSVAIPPAYRGRRLSPCMVGALRALASAQCWRGPVIPVRPTLKATYPLTPMRRYITWMTPSGEPFDPWIRLHWRLGGRLLQVAEQSMVIAGTVEEWESWTGMIFPESGEYVVSGALSPISIDRERNIGRYTEPNIWMEHQG